MAVPPDSALQTGAMLRSRFAGRPVLLCASTREGEEALILDAWRALAANPASKPPGMLLLLVPRHPQRFDEVARMVEERGLSLARRSALPERMDADVLADAFGRNDLILRTADGRTLSIRFSGKLPPAGRTVAHADVRSGLPAEREWRRLRR